MKELQALLAAAEHTPTFQAPDVKDVIPLPEDGSDPGALQVLVDRYDAHGFAVADVGTGSADLLMPALAAELSLGAAFVPPLYRHGGRDAPSIARISAALNADTEDRSHPSFGRAVGQRFHTDGTLQKIGEVRTSMLLCSEPAASGGVTTLFNATAAYAELLDEDAEAALTLAAPRTLIRQANANSCNSATHGPAFAVLAGELVTRYSITDTDRWAVPPAGSAAALRRAVDFMDRVSRPGSPYYHELRLDARQLILIANTRISHGRTAYQDSPAQRRCLYRSLHLARPRIRQAS